MTHRIGAYVRQNHLALICLCLIVGGGTAWALERNSVKSRHIVNGQVRSIDVLNDALTGRDVDESRLGSVPLADDSDLLDGMDSSDFAGARTLPGGAVAFFNLQTCPSGWSEFPAARGRYIVGMPAGGTVGAAVGTALSNGENRAVGQHNHAVTDPGHSHIYNAPGGPDAGAEGANDNHADPAGPSGTSASPTGITINNAGGVAGTNAPYLQLLACHN